MYKGTWKFIIIVCIVQSRVCMHHILFKNVRFRPHWLLSLWSNWFSFLMAHRTLIYSRGLVRAGPSLPSVSRESHLGRGKKETFLQTEPGKPLSAIRNNSRLLNRFAQSPQDMYCPIRKQTRLHLRVIIESALKGVVGGMVGEHVDSHNTILLQISAGHWKCTLRYKKCTASWHLFLLVGSRCSASPLQLAFVHKATLTMFLSSFASSYKLALLKTRSSLESFTYVVGKLMTERHATWPGRCCKTCPAMILMQRLSEVENDDDGVGVHKNTLSSERDSEERRKSRDRGKGGRQRYFQWRPLLCWFGCLDHFPAGRSTTTQF